MQGCSEVVVSLTTPISCGCASPMWVPGWWHSDLRPAGIGLWSICLPPCPARPWFRSPDDLAKEGDQSQDPSEATHSPWAPWALAAHSWVGVAWSWGHSPAA